MTKALLVLFLFMCWTSLNAQPSLNWAHTFEPGDQDYFIGGVTLDGQSNIYITGGFYNTLDFDPGPDSAILSSDGASDMFIAKYDSNGNYLWAYSIGGIYPDGGGGIALDLNGNILVTGSFGGHFGVDFDPGPDTQLLPDSGSIFLAAYDADGNYQWAKSFGGGSGGGNYILTDNNGDIFVGGKYQCGIAGDFCDFDPGPGYAVATSIGGSSVFFAKYNSVGDFIWLDVIHYGGQGIELSGMAIDASNNLFISGSYGSGGPSESDFDPGPGEVYLPAVSSMMGYFAKYDSAGFYVWAHAIGGGFYSYCNGVVLDSAGFVYVTGSFGETADFDPGPEIAELTAPGFGASPDLYVAKYTLDGEYVWAKQLGTSSSEMGTAIDLDACGNVYVYNSEFNTAGFIKYNPDGDLVWELPLNSLSTGNINIYEMEIGASGDIVAAGNFWGTVDFDPGIGIDTASVETPFKHFFASYKIDGAGANGPVNGNASVCLGDTVTYSIAAVPGATGYVWSLPAGWTGTSTTNSITTVPLNNGLITVDVLNGCGISASQSLSVMVSTQPPGLPQIIYDFACEMQGVIFSAVGDSDATSYDWNMPPDWSDNTDALPQDNIQDSIYVYVYGNGSLSVSASNGCPGPVQTISVIPATVPATPELISGNTSICAGASETYIVADNDTSVTSFTWIVSIGWSGASDSSSIHVLPSESNNMVVKANNVCGASPPFSITVTLNETDTTVTVSDSVLIASINNETYQWVDCVAFESVTGQTSQSFVAEVSGSYAVVVGVGGCVDTSGCHAVIVNEVEDTLNRLVAVFPNPSTGTFQIVCAGNRCAFEVFNALGQKVFESPYAVRTSANNAIELESAGLYVLKITDERETTFVKLTVQ